MFLPEVKTSMQVQKGKNKLRTSNAIYTTSHTSLTLVSQALLDCMLGLK